MKRLPLIVHTLYAELADLCRADEQSPWPPSAGLVKVQQEGQEYWYLQKSIRTSPGKYQQRKYLGPVHDPDLLPRVEAFLRAKEAYGQRQELVRTLKSTGVAVPTGKMANILLGLGDSGLLDRAVLVGTVAFQAYGPMLGVRFRESAFQTMDIDLAHRKVVLSLRAPEGVPDLLGLLQEIDPTFFPVPGIHRKAPPVSYINRSRIRVDVLVPMAGADHEPKRTSLSSHGHPLRFLDYLLEDTVETVLLIGGGIETHVPRPARYAMHKLIVSQNRTAVEHPKRRKDLEQVAQLGEVLMEEAPEELVAAYRDACSRGPKWRKYLTSGLDALRGDVGEGLKRLFFSE
jgi:hypothetical protein